MCKYPKMTSLLVKYYSLEDNAALIEVGRNCLLALAYEVIYEQKIKICNPALIEAIPRILVKQLNLNCEDQLLLLFGKRIFINQVPLDKHIAKETILTVINEFNSPHIDPATVLLPPQEEDKSSTFSCYNSEESSSSIERRCQINETQGESTFLQTFVPEPKKGKRKLEERKILSYIKALANPKTELCQFCQHLKIQLPSYKRQKVDQIYQVTATLQVGTYFISKLYKGTSGFAKLRKAENHAALTLLEQIWTEYPESWRKFISQRKAMLK